MKTSESQFPLEGRIALVTGAAQGMGASIAACLAESGATVALGDVNLEVARIAADRINREQQGNRCVAVHLDVTSEAQVEGVVDEIVQRFGGIHILVNNAGILYPTRITDISLEEWNRVVDVSLTGSFLCSRAVVPHMRAAGYGRIINMSSSAGRSVSTLGGSHYTSAKAGMLGLSRALAKELAGDGILVNAICPGLIDTEMVRSTCEPSTIERYEQSFPVNRLGTPAEVAEIVRFLCVAGTYITGASIDVNGGDLMM